MVRPRHYVIPSFLFGCLLMSAPSGEARAAEATPWSESFTMPIAGHDRTFAVHLGTSYLVLTPSDTGNRELLLGSKDVVIPAKFERDAVVGTRQRIRLSSFPEIQAEGEASLFATRLDGDNLYFFGQLTMPATGIGRFEIQAIETAPSDAQVIASILAGIKAEDYPARLKAAAVIRDRSLTQPNKEFWLSASDNVVTKIISDAQAVAAKTKDTALLLQAITWAVDVLHDTTAAGRIGSAAWLRAPGVTGAEEISHRLRKLGLELYKDEWRPRAESLSLEFEDRFNAISWKDADAFYRLGRWADVNGEFLPRAKDRSYRCYQAGFRANPNHQGIRNELGMPNAVSGDGTQAAATADFQHPASGTLVPAPQGWKRGERIEGDITWIDPSSETAYIAATIIETPENPSLEAIWQGALTPLRSKPEFLILEDEDPVFPQGSAKRLRWRYREGQFFRLHEMIVALNPAARIAVRLDAGFAEDEAAQVHPVLVSTYDRLVIPSKAPAKP
jgi:hypothetical protein